MENNAHDNFDRTKSLVYLTQKTFVFNPEGKFLALFRTASAPSRPLKWDLPGGAYEIGENPKESAEREIREETGLEVRDLRPLTLVGVHNEIREYWVRVAYTAQTDQTEVKLSFEHQDYRWVTKDEFLALDSSDLWRKVAREYLD
jgi:8-oxo-dGTP diphosphatase